MNIIDDLKLSTDETTVNRYHQLRGAGRLSAAQVRYAEALIAKGGDEDTQAALTAQIAAMKVEAAERNAAREVATLVEGQRVAVTSKKQGRREGVVLWVEDGKAGVRIDNVAMAVTVEATKVEAL